MHTRTVARNHQAKSLPIGPMSRTQVSLYLSAACKAKTARTSARATADKAWTAPIADGDWELPLLEVLVDLPTYFTNVHGAGVSGFTDVSPAIKWQISPVPGGDRSVCCLGRRFADRRGFNRRPWAAALCAIALVLGTQRRLGYQRHVHRVLSPGGFYGQQHHRDDFCRGKKLTERFSLFTEYVGDYPQGAGPSQLWNSGGVFHLTRTQQLIFISRSG